MNPSLSSLPTMNGFPFKRWTDFRALNSSKGGKKQTDIEFRADRYDTVESYVSGESYSFPEEAALPEQLGFNPPSGNRIE